METFGAFFLFLFILFLIGEGWFHFVEFILGGIKRLFTRHREPPPWHPLPPEAEDESQQPEKR